MAVSTAVSEFVWTAEVFERAGQAGVIPGHADLIEGVVYLMAPQGTAHAWAIHALTQASRAVPESFRVGVQLPVRLAESTELEPDLYVARGPWERYRSGHPGADDVELVVEVSDTTLSYDTSIKLTAYRRYGVAEVWIIDLNGRRVVRYLGDQEGEVVTEGSIVHPCGLAVALNDLW